MSAKQRWKIIHRAMRIARREANKASVDCMMYGTGVVRITSDGAKHVPLSDIYSLEQEHNKS